MGEHVLAQELAYAHQDIPDQTAVLVRNNLDVKKALIQKLSCCSMRVLVQFF
jgi:hypothetical protein